jgi:hypothetical protein
MPELVSSRIDLEPAARVAVRAAVEAAAPDFLPRLDGPVDVLRVEQPYFPDHRILEVISGAAPERRIFVAVGAGATTVLTGHPEHLHAMIDAGGVRAVLGPRERAIAYGTTAYRWIHDTAGERELEDFVEIPWVADPTAEQRHQIDLLETMFAHQIEPPIMRHTSIGWERQWVVLVGRTLVGRRLHIPFDGKLVVEDEVLAEDLPVESSP